MSGHDLDQLRQKLDVAKSELDVAKSELDVAKSEMPDSVRVAHTSCVRHRAAIESSGVVGCFYCLEIYPPGQIVDWIDYGQTARCPNCGIDAVLPDSAMPRLDRTFLQSMNKHWF